MFEATQSALSHLFTPIPLIAVLGGAMIGVISGALPGGTVPTLVILMGFAYGMDPYIALPLATGMMATVATGDTLPAVLLGMPGSTSGQATILDGYPMSRQGRAGVALSAAYFSSMIGGVIGAVFLFVTIPVARPVVRTFGSAEFFMFSVIAILVVGVLSSGAFIKGLLAGLLGLAIATVGYDPASGTIRSTFGITYLWDGIPIVPVVIGLFALPEFYDMARTEKPIARGIGFTMSDIGKGRREGIAQVVNNWRLLLRSSIVGVVVGVLPGIGGSLAQWLSYVSALHTVPGGSRTFGSGDIRGVIAPESANNAVDGAQLVPTLMFGVPGSVGMAIFLGFMTVLGIQAGPDMLHQHLDLTLTIVLSLVIANIAATSVLLFFSTSVAKIAFVRPSIVLPLILPVLALAAFQSSRSYGDLVVMIAFGFLGNFMKVRGWPRPPIIIAIVLGPIVEKYYFIATATYGWALFARPAVIAIVLVAAATAFYSAWLQYRSAASGREVGASGRSPVVGNHGDATSKSAANEGPRLDAFPTIAGGSGEESNLEDVAPSDAPSTAVPFRWKDWLRPGPDAIFVYGLLAIFIYDIVASTDWQRGAQLLPRSVGYAGVGLVVIYLIDRFLRRENPVGGRRILDVGQAESDVDPAVQRERLRMALLTTGGLLGGIWVVGFQLTIPIYVGLYLWRIARVHFAYALLSAAGFVLLLYGFYDWLMGVPWPHPLVADYIPRVLTGL